MKILPLLWVLACTAASANAKDPAPYRNTNELVWDKTFTASVTKFFGPLRGSYFWANGLVADQVSAGLGGPPDPIQTIKGTDLLLASACRPNSCSEKAAVVFQGAGDLKAFGVIHYPCFEKSAKAECTEHPTLSIFSKRLPVTHTTRAAIVDWAETQVGKLEVIQIEAVR
jgi:hypothetical protein